MLAFIDIPSKIIKFLKSNVSPNETAAGACLGMFLGFVPLNGPIAFLLAVLFFIFKFNRISTLFVLPVIKLLYLAGVSNLAEKIGAYLLIDANYLENFWRWLLGLPIIAYLNINNTITAGGLALSLILAAPVYIITKRASIILFKSKYYEKLKNLKFVAGNTVVSQTVTQKAKIINIKGIIIAIAALLIFQLGFGLVISPMLSSFAVKKINESSNAKIYLEKIHIWPLTLSVSFKNLKIFNPEAPDERIVLIGSASANISILGLASRKLIISHVNLNNAEINLQGEPDGSFNIQKIASKKATGGINKPNISLWDFTKKNQDWFARIYDFIKKHYSKETIEKIKALRAAAKKTDKTVTELPKGRKVEFKSAGASYLLEVKDFNIRNASLQVKAQDGNTIEVDNANIKIRDIGIDPKNGARVNFLNIFGNIKSAGSPAGNLNFIFSETISNNETNDTYSLNLRDINLETLRFIYGNSLPVDVSNGLLNLQSKSAILNRNINSENKVSLTKHKLAPKAKFDMSKDFMPLPILCEALNNIDPLNLSFKIEGTVEKPEFTGFQKSLIALVKPNMKTIKEAIKNEGINLLGTLLEKKGLKNQSEGSNKTGKPEKNSGAKNAMDSIKSIFGGEKQQE